MINGTVMGWENSCPWREAEGLPFQDRTLARRQSKRAVTSVETKKKLVGKFKKAVFNGNLKDRIARKRIEQRYNTSKTIKDKEQTP